MVCKINGVWTEHCPTSEQEILLKYFDKLDKKIECAERHEFCKKQTDLIMKACYKPHIVLFAEPGEEPKYSDEDLAVLGEVEFYKACYLSTIATNVAVAYSSELITRQEKEEFDNYVQTLFGWR